MIIAELRPYPDQRKSTIPWLPSLPAHWSIRRAKTLFREIDRRTSDGRQPLLSLRMHAGLVDHHASGGKIIPPSALVGYKRVLPGELVMNRMRAAIGLFAGATTEGLVSPDYAVFQVEPTVNLSYAVHLFRTPIMGSVFRMESRGLGTGESGFLRLYTDRFGVLPIPLPPPNEQAAIVRFLDHANRRIDRFIRAKKKLIALLNEQKQAIIHRAVTRGLDPNVPMKDSGVPWLGEVPATWKTMPFVRCTVERADYRGATPEKVAAGIFLVTAKNVRRGWIDYESSKEYVRPSDFPKIMRRGLARIGDILLTTEAPLGHISLVDREDIALAQRIIRFRVDRREFLPEFALYALNSSYFQHQLNERATGSTAHGIKASKLPQLIVALPDVVEQTRIVVFLHEQLQPTIDAIKNTEREVSLIREYRTRLIADVVTGQLDVRAAVQGLPIDDADDGEPVDAGDEIDEAEIDDSEQDEAA